MIDKLERLCGRKGSWSVITLYSNICQEAPNKGHENIMIAGISGENRSRLLQNTRIVKELVFFTYLSFQVRDNF